MIKKELALVILHYGDIALTNKCLDSMAGACASIYVINNGSQELEAKDLIGDSENIEIVSTGCNLGYAGGMNVGIRIAIENGSKYIAVFNNDIVVAPGCIEKIKVRFEQTDGDNICFSPLIMDGKGENIWFGGGQLSWLQARAKHTGINTSGVPVGPVESGFLTGCAFCFKKTAIKDVGYMREDYFLYWEDIDWSLRFRRKGYRLYVYPDILIKHAGSAATGLESGNYLYYFHRNQLRFLFNNCPLFLLPFALTGFTVNLMRICSAWLFKHGKEGRAKIKMTLKGIFDFAVLKKGRIQIVF
jgi:GT2 family glycosyltransferase